MDFIHSVERIIFRNVFLNEMRNFFSQRGYIELQSPVLSPYLIPERTIDIYALSDSHAGRKRAATRLFLTPSPEINIKYILSRLSEQLLRHISGVYEITHSFRKGEEISPVHEREFLMLEWYSLCRDSYAMIEETKCMIEVIIAALLKSYKGFSLDEAVKTRLRNLCSNFQKMSLRDAFFQFCNIDLTRFFSSRTVHEAMKNCKIECTQEMQTWEDAFQYLIVQFLEPSLPQSQLLFLYDYPSALDTLAKRKDQIWNKRWELYGDALEIGNCYDEENDPTRIAQFIDRQSSTPGARSSSVPCYPQYLQQQLLPNCSGLALGIDRLLMVMLGAQSLREVSFLHSDFFDS